MGDIVILNANELKQCLEFGLKPLLETYAIEIKESQLVIKDKIYIQASLIYQEHMLDLNASLLIDYQDKKLCFQNIDGKIEYIFLTLNVLNVLKQFIHDEKIIFKDKDCYYICDLPISHISIKDNCVDVEFLES